MIICRPVEPERGQVYRIVIPEDKNNTHYYCRERLEQNIRDYVSGMKTFEIEVALDELKKMGVLVTQPNTPRK